MPAIINFAANLALGAGIVLALRQGESLRKEYVNWGFMIVLVFEAAIFTPVAAYLFRFYPQWSMLYSFDPQIYPTLDDYIPWMCVAVILLNFVALIGAYSLSRIGVMRAQRALVFAPLLVAVVLLLGVLLLYGERLFFIGDYDEFWQGQASLFLSRVPGLVGTALYVMGITVILWVQAKFGHRDSRFLEV